jgi:hypothetical protein
LNEDFFSERADTTIGVMENVEACKYVENVNTQATNEKGL